MTERPELITPPDLPPTAGFSHVAVVPAGRQVLTSGQVAVSSDGTAPEGWEAQTRLVFTHLGRALAAGGAGWKDVVRLMVYVTSVDELATFRAVRDEFVDVAAPPTSSLVQVAGLFRPDLLLEVEAVASLPG